MSDFDDAFDCEDYQELETVDGYYSPYCTGCDTTFLFWWRQYLGDSDSEPIHCPNCAQELGMLETEFKLLGQMKGKVGEEIYQFKSAAPETLRNPLPTPEEIQKATRAMEERNPSEEIKEPWIYAYRKVGKYHKPTERNGKWLIFVPIRNINRAWAIIRQATEEGKLGESSKVSTAYSNKSNPDKKVICVYTYDWTDAEDVRRIREELRALGVKRKIAYKSDEDTRSGKYRKMGHTKISKYYE